MNNIDTLTTADLNLIIQIFTMPGLRHYSLPISCHFIGRVMVKTYTEDSIVIVSFHWCDLNT